MPILYLILNWKLAFKFQVSSSFSLESIISFSFEKITVDDSERIRSSNCSEDYFNYYKVKILPVNYLHYDSIDIIKYVYNKINVKVILKRLDNLLPLIIQKYFKYFCKIINHQMTSDINKYNLFLKWNDLDYLHSFD